MVKAGLPLDEGLPLTRFWKLGVDELQFPLKTYLISFSTFVPPSPLSHTHSLLCLLSSLYTFDSQHSFLYPTFHPSFSPSFPPS